MKKFASFWRDYSLAICLGLLIIGNPFKSDDIFEGVYIGHPVFTEGATAPIGNRVTMAACDGERIYILQGSDGVMTVYSIGGKLLGTYAFYEDAVNGSFLVFCDAGTTYVFDKNADLYVFDGLQLIEYTAHSTETRALRSELKKRGDEYISHLDSRGVWFQGDDGVVLVLPTPVTRIKTVAIYMCCAVVILVRLCRTHKKLKDEQHTL